MTPRHHTAGGRSRAEHAIAVLGAALVLVCGCAESEGDADASALRGDAADSDHDAAAGDGDDSTSGDGDGDGNGDSSHSGDAATDDLDASDESASDASDELDASTDGDPDASEQADASDDVDAMLPALEDLPYVGDVVSFEAGEHAGFGQTGLPDIVLGPPKGRGTSAGGMDVVSLGAGGEIVLDFGALDVVDGEGADFIVFENAFWASGDPSMVFAELGEVSVSEDGTTWHTFACDQDGNAEDEYLGCAGWSPTLRFDPQIVFPLDPELTGGDAFDLADLDLERARYVRIRDLGTQPYMGGNSSGFDLDAIGLVHFEEAR